MQRRVNALEGLNPEDQLAWLLLRVVAELSPCTERSLLAIGERPTVTASV